MTDVDTSRPGSSILVLHSPTLDPHPFIGRLIASPSFVQDDPVGPIPWRIDNKYYTADVHFRLQELLHESPVSAEDIGVVLYLFDTAPPDPLPAALTRLIVNQPRDIALAIRVTLESPEESLDEAPRTEQAWEDVEEAFDELGMEVVDELASPEDDDERPIPPLEAVRQTLMTHMWPNMVRKPVGVRMPSAAEELDPQGDDSEVGREEEEEASSFPVTFQKEAAAEQRTDALFPSLSELRAQLPAASSAFGARGDPIGKVHVEGEDEDEYGNDNDNDNDEMTALDRLDVLGEAFGLEPGPEEYARLDEWLDDEEEDHGHDYGFMPLEDEEDHIEFGEYQDVEEGITGHRIVPRDIETLDGFEDDFSGLAVPPGRASLGQTIPLDPTPLLLHLQSIRAELMAVEDEDERRVRAGREVEAVMGGFGMDLDFGDLEGEV